jgi:APA family basic amino acid/polyamine antiporter
VGFCLYLMYETGWQTWIQFAVFLAVGLLVYVAYGRRHSTLVTALDEAEEAAPEKESQAV